MVKKPRIKIRTLVVLLFATAACILLQAPKQASGRDITRTFRQLMPGCRYYSIYRDNGPYSINVIKARYIRNRYLSMGTIIGNESMLDLAPVSLKAKELQSANTKLKPVVGINGDFYHGAPLYGAPLGVTIRDRELVSVPRAKRRAARPTFFVDTKNVPHIGSLDYDIHVRVSRWKSRITIDSINQIRSSGDMVIFTPILGKSTKTSSSGVEVVAEIVVGVRPGDSFMFLPERIYQAKITAVRDGGGNSKIPRSGFVLSASGSAAAQLRSLRVGTKIYLEAHQNTRLRNDVLHAISGWPVILEDGINLGTTHGEARHPRTAIGFNDQEIIVAVVDGRQPGHSIGMTLAELGDLMKKQGATHAINLDGGGSTTMWTRSMGVVNRPSDGRERRIGNSFFFFSSAPVGDLTYLVPEPDDISIFTSESLQIFLTGEDKHHNPVEFNSQGIKWKNDNGIGRVDGYGFFRAGKEAGTGFVGLTLGNIKSRVKVNVYETPPYLMLLPRALVLEKGKSYKFRLFAKDFLGRDVQGDLERIAKWKVTPGLGTIDSNGYFTAGSVPKEGRLEVWVGEARRMARITVGTAMQIIDGFEDKSNWRYASYPKGHVKGSFVISGRAKYKGSKGGILKYRFTTNSGVQAAYARNNFDKVIGTPEKLTLMVKGDGSDQHIRVAYVDAKGIRYTLPIVENLKSRRWKKVEVKFPSDTAYPISLESVYVFRERDSVKPRKGYVYIDTLLGYYKR